MPGRPPTGATPTDPVTVVIGVPESRQLGQQAGIGYLAGLLSSVQLVGPDSTGKTVPRLLDSFSELEGGLAWRLVLRDHLFFHDGSPLDASAVKAHLDRVRANPDSMSVCASDISDVIVESPRQTLIRLNRRCAFLLDDVETGMRIPAEHGRPEVGSGPFRIVARAADEVSLESNPSYYLGAPAINRVKVKAYDTLRTAWADMLRGNVDFLWSVGPDAAALVGDQRAVDARSFLSYYAYMLMMNAARPAFKSSDVRRAMNLAIDRRELVALGLRGQGRPGDDPIWPALWARDPTTSAWPLDYAAARQAFAKAAGPGRRFSFSCLVPVDFTTYERLALLLQRQLRTVGVDMRIEALPLPAYLDRITTGNFDTAILNPTSGPYQTIYYRFWHSPDPKPRWNYWSYADAAVDRALDRMREAASEGDTRAAFRDLAAAFRANPPVAVLAWNDAIQAINRRFELPESAAGRDALNSLSRWALRPPQAVTR